MKPIPMFNDYSATESGEIYRTSYSDNQNLSLHELLHKLTPSLDRYGYSKVVLSVKGKTYYRTVHRLVALTFLENKDNLPMVNHKNGNKVDNRVENLEWISPRDNVLHAHRTHLHNGCRTAVTLQRNEDIKRFDSITEAAKYLNRSRDCFRRNLTCDSRHGEIDGWYFELVGGKERRWSK